MHSGKPLTERLRLHSVRRVDHVLTGPSATVYALSFIIRAGISKQFHTLRAEIDPPGSATECFTHPGCPRHAGEVHCCLTQPVSSMHCPLDSSEGHNFKTLEVPLGKITLPSCSFQHVKLWLSSMVPPWLKLHVMLDLLHPLHQLRIGGPRWWATSRRSRSVCGASRDHCPHPLLWRFVFRIQPCFRSGCTWFVLRHPGRFLWSFGRSSWICGSIFLVWKRVSGRLLRASCSPLVKLQSLYSSLPLHRSAPT